MHSMKPTLAGFIKSGKAHNPINVEPDQSGWLPTSAICILYYYQYHTCYIQLRVPRTQSQAHHWCHTWQAVNYHDGDNLSLMRLTISHHAEEREHDISFIIHSVIARFPSRRSGALQETFYGSPPACPVLGGHVLPPCKLKALQIAGLPRHNPPIAADSRLSL